MKKAISLFILVVLTVSLFSVIGCSSTADNGENGGFTGNTIPGGIADVSQETLEALQKSGKVKVYTFGNDMTSVHSGDNGWFNHEIFQEYFKAVYGGELEIVNGLWKNWEQRFLIEFAAGDAPDLIYSGTRLWPKVANREMVYSLSEMKEMGLVGLDHPVLQDGMDIVERNFTFKNEVYGFALQDVQCYWLIVNTDLYKKYEVKSPVEYYNEGLWDFDTFVKSSQELTDKAGLDANGLKNASGYYCWDPNAMLIANGQQLVTIDRATGEMTLNLEKAEVVDMLEMYSDAVSQTGFINLVDTFANGTVGCVAWLDKSLVQVVESGLTFNWDIVPYPLGENNTEGTVFGTVRPWSVVTSSENPQGAVNLVIALKAAIEQGLLPTDRYDLTYYFEDKPEISQMIKDIESFGINDNQKGIANFEDINYALWPRLQKGQTVNEAIQALKPKFLAEINAELTGVPTE